MGRIVTVTYACDRCKNEIEESDIYATLQIVGEKDPIAYYCQPCCDKKLVEDQNIHTGFANK